MMQEDAREVTGINRQTLWKRIASGWSTEKLLTQPVYVGRAAKEAVAAHEAATGLTGLTQPPPRGDG